MARSGGSYWSPRFGCSPASLTGQAYAGLGEISFPIQDEAGMVPVAWLAWRSRGQSIDRIRRKKPSRS